MKRPNPLQHAMDRFTADPASVRNAAYVMIIITVGIVLVGGVIVWVFDRRDFPDLGGALWYTLQTVTTVGYGDKVPTEGIGRLVGAAVMVVAVALIAILTASITSTFVEAAQRRHRAGVEAQERDSAEALRQQLVEVLARLAAIEAALKSSALGAMRRSRLWAIHESGFAKRESSPVDGELGTILTIDDLVLRPWRLADAPEVLAICQDPEIARWVTIPQPFLSADADAFIQNAITMWRDGTGAAFAIVDAATDRLLGAVTRFGPEGHQATFGLWLAPIARVAVWVPGPFDWWRTGRSPRLRPFASTRSSWSATRPQIGWWSAPGSGVRACSAPGTCITMRSPSIAWPIPASAATDRSRPCASGPLLRTPCLEAYSGQPTSRWPEADKGWVSEPTATRTTRRNDSADDRCLGDRRWAGSTAAPTTAALATGRWAGSDGRADDRGLCDWGADDADASASWTERHVRLLLLRVPRRLRRRR